MKPFSLICFSVLSLALVGSLPAMAEGSVVASRGDVQVTADDLTADLAGRPADFVKRMREPGATGAERLVTDIMLRRLVAKKAQDEGLIAQTDVADRLRLAQERTLYEIYMERAEAQAIKEDKIEALARDEYRAFPEKYTKPEEIRVRHILFRPCNCDKNAHRVLAESVLERLQKGESFEELATALSEDPGSAKRGGDLGLKPKGAMVPEFEAAAYALKKPGELSGIVETTFGLHIIRLEERVAAKLRPFDEVKEGLMESTRTRVRAEIRKKIADPLRDPATLSIDAEAIRRALAK
ncbi:peptidylprolyl isomerase [Zoogloea sp.]|uniref:peptidylprolyl isomerase n=1 Tax=Zoogloea sp. TaxID=49181 RepID=UPI0014168D74|nr:MAG: peptidylprolyl isomerase [Zoogloea sp.]